jgi:segregation and condensation protein A
MAQKGDWVVMAAWLLHLRSLLLLPADNLTRKAASEEAERFRDRLSGLAEIQALAAWLDRRPRLGRDVFDRGEPPEGLGAIAETGAEIDVIEFLWASMALFDDGAPGPDVSETWRPPGRELYSVAAARARILTLLAETPEGRSLEALLPDESAADVTPVDPGLRKRGAWSSTFIAGLELAKQGEVALAQEAIFTAIRVSPVSAEPPG